MQDGFILLHRMLLENAIFYKPNYFQVWIYILLKVNHQDREMIWNGEKKIIEKGAGIFSQKKISEEIGISIGTVSNILKYLKTESQIEIKTCSKFTEIKVVKWKQYQDVESIIENRMKASRKQNENRMKQTIHLNIENKDIDTKISLNEECSKFTAQYGIDMIEDFLRNRHKKMAN